MTAALIIASGKTNSKTHFEPEKMIGSITAMERVSILLQQAGIQRIVVVSEEDDKIRKLRSSISLTFLSSPVGGDMLDSIKSGIAYLYDKCTEVLLVYVDIPMFSVRTIHALMETEGDICIPSYQGAWGHPILLRAQHFQKVLSYQGEGGLRGAINAAGLVKRIVEVDDAGIRADIQRGVSYRSLLDGHDAAKLRLSYQFNIGRERIFYNADTHQLLCLVEELGSLSKACVYMGISLNKGRTIISTIEQQLGRPILKTQQGGKTGGYSHLTEDAKELMSSYQMFCLEAADILQSLFQKHFASQMDKWEQIKELEGGIT